MAVSSSMACRLERRQDRLVERLPAVRRRGGGDVVKIALLIFAEQDGLARAQVAAHDFHEKLPAAADFRCEPLGDDVTQGFREPLAHLALLRLLEHAEDAVDGLTRVDRVQAC